MFGFLKKAVNTIGKVPVIGTAAKAGINITTAPIKFTANVASGKNVGKSFVKSAATPFVEAKKVVKNAARDVKAGVKIAGKVPVVGKGLAATATITAAPLLLAGSIASGERIDQAVLKNLKTQVRAVKDQAPYARMVVSLVPGVGTGAAAAISAGAALAEGQPISSAIVAGIQGALPGGALATSTFSAAFAAVGGNPSALSQFNALKLSPEQRKDVNTVLNGAKQLSGGLKVDTKATVTAKAKLPKDLRIALDTGIAVAHGQKLQQKVKKSVTPTVLNSLSKKGAAIAATNAVVKAGVNRIKNPKMAAGYKVGVAVANSPATALKLSALSANLRPDEQRGFEVAIAEKIGSVEEEVPAEIQGNADAEFAFAVTMGAQTMSAPARESLIESMAKDPKLLPGVEAATKSLTLTGRFKAFIKRVVKAIKGK